MWLLVHLKCTTASTWVDSTEGNYKKKTNRNLEKLRARCEATKNYIIDNVDKQTDELVK